MRENWLIDGRLMGFGDAGNYTKDWFCRVFRTMEAERNKLTSDTNQGDKTELKGQWAIEGGTGLDDFAEIARSQVVDC